MAQDAAPAGRVAGQADSSLTSSRAGEAIMLERKGLGIRLGAAIIDGLIVGVINMVLATVAGVVGIVIGALVMIAYPAIEVLKARSPGKMALKLKVVSEDGSPATRDQLVQRAIIRWIGTIAGGALTLVALAVPSLAYLGNLGLFGISIALLALSWKTLQTTRQGYWDVRAKTAVVGPAVAVPAGLAPSASPQVPPPVA
jgi:uncharacterized RDD family membrane protein YckC